MDYKLKSYFYLDRIQDFGVLWPVILSLSDQERGLAEVLLSKQVLARDLQQLSRTFSRRWFDFLQSKAKERSVPI